MSWPSDIERKLTLWPFRKLSHLLTYAFLQARCLSQWKELLQTLSFSEGLAVSEGGRRISRKGRDVHSLTSPFGLPHLLQCLRSMLPPRPPFPHHHHFVLALPLLSLPPSCPQASPQPIALLPASFYLRPRLLSVLDTQMVFSLSTLKVPSLVSFSRCWWQTLPSPTSNPRPNEAQAGELWLRGDEGRSDRALLLLWQWAKHHNATLLWVWNCSHLLKAFHP
jgi:hypothetical protein